MAIYYVDFYAEPGGDGTTPETAAARETDLTVLPGDTVLFRRGTAVRGRLYNVNGSAERPVTYGAYGTGAAPVFCGSTDLTGTARWTEISPNIWRTAVSDEFGNVIADGVCGTLRWSVAELCAPGDFYDNGFGCGAACKPYPEEHYLYFYFEENPGRLASLEGAGFGCRCLAKTGENQIIENLHFTKSGVHAIATGVENRNFFVRNCRFTCIGGCVWSPELRVRYGNGVEFWQTCDNVEVTDCVFDDIYDSAVTHQGEGDNCFQAGRFLISGNVFTRCGMAAYEQRDKMPLAAVFCNNTCSHAGEGFSKNGEQMPRRSEIWPQPMGHHIFLWRMDKADAAGQLKITGNHFESAPFGAAVYSIICRDCENQVIFEANAYSGDMLLCARWNGDSCADAAVLERKTLLK